MIRTAAVLTLAALAAAPLSAHVGETIYPIYELPTSGLPDLHDGTLADWEEVLPGPTVDFRDFVSQAGVGDSAPIDVNDLAYRFFLAWHGASGRLYAAVERIDDVYVNRYGGQRPGEVWMHDNVELMVDGDHSGGEYAGFTKNALRLSSAQAQQYLVLPESPDGQLLYLTRLDRNLSSLPPLQSWVAQPPYADAGSFVFDGSPSVAFIELYVTPFDDLDANDPDRSLPSRLAAGGVIGLSLSVADFDSAPREYHAYHTLAGQEATWRFAERFVDGLLVGCDVEDCSAAPAPVSAVAADSWGRIKAGLRLGP